MPAAAERSLLLKLKEDRQGNALLTAARDLDKLAHGADTAGGSFKGMSSDAQLLNRQIAESTTRVKDLQTQIARTGDRSLFGDLRKERSALAELQRLAKDIAPAVEKSFTSHISEAFSGSGGAIQAGVVTGLVGAAVLVSPAIGAIIGGAVIGAVGAGGIIGGVVAAAHDDRVKSAWKSFSEDFTKEAFGSEAFVGPTIAAIGVLQRGFADLDIGDALAKGAASVPVLAKGISDLLTNLMPGFNAIMDKSAVISEILADGFGEVGESFGEFLSDIASSEGTLDGLRTLFAATAGTIEFAGDVLTDLSDIYHGFLGVVEDVSGALEDIPGFDQTGWAKLNDDMESLLGKGPQVEKVITGIGEATTEVNGPFDLLGSAILGTVRATEEYANAAYDAAIATGDLSAAWDMLHGTQLSADQALVRAHEAMAQIKETFSDGTKSIQGNSQAAAENRLELERAAQVAVSAAEGYLRLTGDVAGAQKMLADFEKQAVDSAGATGKQKDAVKQLADQLFRLPEERNVRINVTQVNTIIGAALGAAGAAANKIISSIFRAEGGPVSARRPYVVGEEGPEVMVPAVNGRVVSNKDLALMSPVSGGGGSAAPLRLQLGGTPANALERMFVDWLMEAMTPVIQARGGPVRAFG